MQQIHQTPNSSTWLLAAEAYPNIEREARIQTARFIGALTVRDTATMSNPETNVNNSTLLAAIQLASLGDKQSLDMVRTNVATDVAERLFKVGHQTKVHLDFTNGQLRQSNRPLTTIYRNSLEHTYLNPIMKRRAQTELKNALLFELLIKDNITETHHVVIFSTATRDIQTKKDYGFFEDTDTCSIQMLRQTETGFAIETALVAGKKTPNHQPHDLAAIQTLVGKKGLELVCDDADEMLQYLILVPKADAPNGVQDIVKLYDEAAGGTFYGEAKPQQDYQAFAEQCAQRNESFTAIVDKITNQLLSEVHTFKTPLEAIERLDYLSERFCVRQAVSDTSVNEAIFGKVAAGYIQEARYLYQQGDYEGANFALRNAQRTANSSSCPFFKQISDQPSQFNNYENRRSNHEVNSTKKWMNCPYCSARVFADPCAKVLSCWDCKAVVVNGRILSKGNGGRKRYAAKQLKTKLFLGVI